MTTKCIHHPGYRAMMQELRNTRRAAGMTQKELAERLGWTQQKVSKVESCETPVTLIELVAFCRVLKVPVTRLLEQIQ